jgi:hypothetical protein
MEKRKKSINGFYQITLDPVVILHDTMAVMVMPFPHFTTGTRPAAKHYISSTTRHSNNHQYLLRAYKSDDYQPVRLAGG